MVIPQWGLSILTGVWREEKGGCYLAWSFPFTGRGWPSIAISSHIKYLDESTCEYSVLVSTGGREGRKEARKEGHIIYIKHLLHARHGTGCWQTSGWEGVRERKEVDMMEVFDRTESLFLLSWPGAAPAPCAFSFFLFIIWSHLVACLSGSALTHLEWKMRWVWYLVKFTSPVHQQSGNWGRNAGNLRALLEEDLLLVARPATDRSWNLRQITVFFYICSLRLSVVFKSSGAEPAHLGFNPDSATY